jgi:CRISPR/Cas system CSM-associated protein Csm2 small subunit
MPKHFIKFNLPEEQEELDMTMKAGEYHCMLHDLYTYRRELYKYDERDTIPKEELIERLDQILEGFGF